MLTRFNFFPFPFLPSLEVWYCKVMPTLSLCFILSPKSTVQASSSEITVMFRVQIFYSLFYILCFLTEGLAAHKKYNFTAEAILIHTNPSYSPPIATQNSLSCVNIILWQEAHRFISHHAWSWQTIISLNFSIKRKI